MLPEPQLSGQNGALKGDLTGRLSLPSVGSADDSDGGRAPTIFSTPAGDSEKHAVR